jgi:GTP-binding protein EngB required for normal cell division
MSLDSVIEKIKGFINFRFSNRDSSLAKMKEREKEIVYLREYAEKTLVILSKVDKMELHDVHELTQIKRMIKELAIKEE